MHGLPSVFHSRESLTWNPKESIGNFLCTLAISLICLWLTCDSSAGQEPPPASPQSPTLVPSREDEFRLGSMTAKGGFQNEDEIRDKFNNWKSDTEARSWLAQMNFDLSQIESVHATKPHGQKSDVELLVKTRTAERREGISIKLVSNLTGFNQIDKRWLKSYAEMWSMPKEVHDALKLFVGEEKTSGSGRDPKRLYLNELNLDQRQLVVDFFTKNRKQIVKDLFAGDGQHAAGWFMVTMKSQVGNNQSGDSASTGRQRSTGSKETGKSEASDKPNQLETRWVICPSTVAADFFGDGPIQITAAGNLKIGRITMQRKGGDNGRETANMLQFKINPVELFGVSEK